MPLRRTCLLALTTGLLVLTGCGSPPQLTRTVPQSPVETAKHPPPTVPEPDVRSALAALVQVARWATPPTTTTTTTTVPHKAAQMSVVSAPVISGQCGGDLPPCYVLQRESHGNPYAVEPSHQGAPYGDPGDPWHHASGLWQAMPSTWAGYAGYPYAAAAPVAVQNEWAAQLWDGGRGCGHWSACG